MTAAETPVRLVGTSSVPLAWRNLVANKRRLIRSSAGIGFAVLLMLVQLGFERGFFDASLATVRLIDGDLVMISASSYRFGSADPFSPDRLATAASVAGVASVAPLHASWSSFFWKDPAGDQTYLIQAFAFDPDHPAFRLPEVTALAARLKEDDAVIVDRQARGFLGMAGATGDSEINGRKVHIVGSFALGPDFMSDGTVLMSAATFARLLPGNQQGADALPVEFGVVKLRPGENPPWVQQALQAALPGDVRVMTKPQLVDFEREFQADVSSAAPIFLMGTVVGFVVGVLISYQIIYTDLSDQVPQYATLKGMGYQSAYLVRVVLEQAALSGLAGYVPAWLACLLVYRGVGALTLLPLEMTLRLTLLSLGLTLGMCLLSAILAIRRVIAADPAEVF
ncbi:MAG TPA: FtsX-like permease family protein [Stellaceae bacterium]|nr:FtsX-like permease family protein [Stellaceae bacterium]